MTVLLLAGPRHAYQSQYFADDSQLVTNSIAQSRELITVSVEESITLRITSEQGVLSHNKFLEAVNSASYILPSRYFP